jgi:lipopolysaccharide cholinephosphotransferase
MGLSIDVFPLDVCTEHMCGFWPQLKMKLFILQLTLAKLIAFDDKAFYKKWIIRYCKKRGTAHFNQKILKLVEKESAKGNTHCGRLTWPLLGKKEIVPLSVFSETVEMTFEGESYPVPSHYDLYLRTLYGDYIQAPPLEEQVSHHSYTAYLKDN